MRNSDQGCSQKCVLIKTIADKDLERHKAVIKKLLDFQWCDLCSRDDFINEENGSTDKKKPVLCKMGCGPKFVKLCMPAIKNFGKKE